MSDDPNPFYSAETFDPPLEIVAQISLNDMAYQFEYLVLWRVKGTQDYYTASDSGCSCPTPFEGFNTLADLTPVGVRHLTVPVPGPHTTAAARTVRTAFRKLVEQAEASIGSDADRFWGVPPTEGSVKDFVKCVERAERAYRRARVRS